MAPRCLFNLAAIAIVLLAPRVVHAQVVGSITGTVTDQTGTPLGGVRIAARSDTQIGGVKSTYSDEPGLLPPARAAAGHLRGHRLGARAEVGGAEGRSAWA